jgi:hypothetical protein
VRINEANHVTIRNCNIHYNDAGIMSNGGIINLRPTQPEGSGLCHSSEWEHHPTACNPAPFSGKGQGAEVAATEVTFPPKSGRVGVRHIARRVFRAPDRRRKEGLPHRSRICVE